MCTSFFCLTSSAQPNVKLSISSFNFATFGGGNTSSSNTVMSFVLPVFGTNGSKKVLDFGRRSGSGDWVKDRVSWKEELQYKIDMGYMSHMH